MSAISHIFGNDIDLVDGLFAVVSDAEEVRQRLLRRLCTNPGDYIWQPDFGTGLPAMIGDPIDTDQVRGLIMGQVAQDPGVDGTWPVTVVVTVGPNGRYDCAVSYTDVASQTAQKLQFSS